MGKHKQADENFLLAQPMVIELGRNALKIFKSSEPNEKRQLLNFLLQNCLLDGKTLSYTHILQASGLAGWTRLELDF